MSLKDKIKTREELASLCEAFRRNGQTVGFTSGAFDILHAGHVDYLEKASGMCDVLITGVNSDESVKKYKGKNRPINSQDERAIVVAGLESISFVFIFSERRNSANIESLKPDLYIKAGDYSENKLTSKEIVEKHGGKAILITIQHNVSTSQIISKLSVEEEVSEEEGTLRFNAKSSKSGPVVFFDRDGTINKEIGYLHEPEKFELLPNAAEGIKKLYDMEYRIAVATNQPGIGLGYYTKEDFFKVNMQMLKELSLAGIMIEKTYFCGHSKSENCDCRKPEPAMILRGLTDLGADPTQCYMVGDRTCDIEAGKRAGVNTILVKTGSGGKDGEYEAIADYVASDLLDAAEHILSKERKRD